MPGQTSTVARAMPASGRPRVVIADDHTLVAEAFTRLLEPEFQVVGTVGDGRALLELASKLKPDVVLLDLGMPLLNGLAAGERLKQLAPATKIVILTMSEEPAIAEEALQTWASGFLVKQSAATELVQAIREVLEGRQYVTSCMTHALDESVKTSRPVQAKALTPRQREVLQLLAEGCTMKEAANVLHVTPRTVAFHKYKIMDEFGLKTNSDLVRFAIRENVVSQF